MRPESVKTHLEALLCVFMCLFILFAKMYFPHISQHSCGMDAFRCFLIGIVDLVVLEDAIALLGGL